MGNLSRDQTEAVIHKTTLWAAATLLVSASVFGQTAKLQETRGALLYDAHCVACHTEQTHWLDKRTVTDWPRLKEQVRLWQGNASLNWGEDDIDAVAHYLNARFYHFSPASTAVSLAQPRLLAPTMK